MKSKPGCFQLWEPSLQTALALLILLLAIYGLSYSGRFSTDDEHILASRSLSLAFQGELNDDRVLGNSRIFIYRSLPAEQAAASLAIEPLQSVTGAGLARLSLLLESGRVQTLFLLNIFATALTAVCVFIAVRVLRYPVLTALVTALFFGLGTQAWVYTRTFFRDPLAMLFLTFAWTCALILNQAPSKRSQRLAGAGILLGLGLGILSKNTATIALPAIAILLMPYWKSLRSEKNLPLRDRLARPGVYLPALVALAGFLTLLFAARGPLVRFSLSYYWDTLIIFATSPHPHFLPALFGPFISPGKSIFIYSPVLLLSLVTLVEKRIEAIAAWSYVLLLVIAQALFYDSSWWGSVNWGLRFLLPAIPLLSIAAAGVLDRLLAAPKGWIWIAFLGCISALVQLIGISTPLGEYYQYLMSITQLAAGTLGVWDLHYSALVWTAARVFSGQQWDLASLGNGIQGLFFAVAYMLLAYLAFLKRHIRPAWVTSFLLVCACLAVLLMPKVYTSDPVYSFDRSDLRNAQNDLLALAGPADGLVVNSYGTPAWRYWMNWGPDRPAWVSLPFLHAAASERHPQVEIILTEAARTHERVWLLLPCDSPSSAALLAQKDQLPYLELAAERTYIDGTCSTSLLLFRSH